MRTPQMDLSSLFISTAFAVPKPMKITFVALLVLSFCFGSLVQAAESAPRATLQLVFDVTETNFKNLQILSSRSRAGGPFNLSRVALIINHPLQQSLLQSVLENSGSSEVPQLVENKEQRFAIFNISFPSMKDRENCFLSSDAALVSEARAPDDDGRPMRILNLDTNVKQTQLVALRSGEIDVNQSEGGSIAMKSWRCTSQNPYAPENRGPRWIVEKHAEVEMGAYAGSRGAGQYYSASVTEILRPAACAN